MDFRNETQKKLQTSGAQDWALLDSHAMLRFVSLAALGATCSQGLLFNRIPYF